MKTINKKIIISVFLLILTIIIRIPNIPNEKGVDSFYIHSLSKYIQNDGYAKWTINPLSLFGLYPYSYSSGISYLLVIISETTSLNLHISILFFSIVVGIIGFLGMQIFIKKYTDNFLFQTIATFIFVTSPLFVNYSTWTISTRAPFMILIPYLLWIVLKYDQTKNIKYIYLFACITLISLITHRMFMLILITLIPSYFLAKYFYKNKDKIIKNKILLLILGIVILILFLIQFSNIGPYKSYAWTYRAGEFLEAGNIIDYRTGNLNMFKIGANMLIDYLSNIGLLSGTIIITLIYYLYTIQYRNIKEIFILILLLSATPFLINGRYTNFFYLPIFSILAAEGTMLIILSNKIDKKIKKISMTIILIISIIFTSFLITHWSKINTYAPEKFWMTTSEKLTINFISKININSNSVLISNTLLNQRVRAFVNYPILPSTKIEDIALLVYDYISHEEVSLDISLKYILTPTKSFIKQKEIVHNPRDDWSKLAKNKIYTHNSQKIINKYSIKYILEHYNYISKQKLDLYASVQNSESKIYDNNEYFVMYIN